MTPPLQLPTARGQWLLRGDQLTCRLPGRAVKVRAPHGVLRGIMDLCNGHRTWPEIVGQLGRSWNPEDLESLLSQLTHDEVLSEPDRSETACTFADQPLDAQAFHGLLAELGLAGAGGPVQWFAAVLRELPPCSDGDLSVPPAVYWVHPGPPLGMALEPMPSRQQHAWRCLRDPRPLRFASALILPVTTQDERTSAASAVRAQIRALQFAAERSGVACAVREDTHEADVLALTGHEGAPGFAGLPALLVGRPPSKLQRELARNNERIALVSNGPPPTVRTTESERGFAFAAGLPGAKRGLNARGAGRSPDPRTAIAKAEAEVWERLGWMSPSGLVEATLEQAKGAIHPDRLLGYADHQYASKNFPFDSFSAERTYWWKEATDVLAGRTCLVLADCLYTQASLPERAAQTRACTNASTSGMAAGSSLEEATIRATLELIERDAFLCTWVAGHAPAHIAPESLPESQARRIAHLAEAGLTVRVLDISTSWAPVVAVFAQHERMPFTTITAASDFSPEDALARALDEAEGRFASAQRTPRVQKKSADAMSDIDRCYRNPQTFRQSDFYAASPHRVDFKSVGMGAASDWECLLLRLKADSASLLTVDMTPPGAALDQGRTRLHVVRALVPGLLPIWFQRGLEPQAMPRFANRAALRGARPAEFLVHPFT